MAAVVFLSSTLEQEGIDYLQILAVTIPTTFVACMLTAAIMMAWDKMRGTTELHTLEIYQERKAAGLIAPTGRQEGREITWAGKRSVAIFLLGLLAVMAYSTAISDKVGLIKDPPMTLPALLAGRHDQGPDPDRPRDRCQPPRGAGLLRRRVGAVRPPDLPDASRRGRDRRHRLLQDRALHLQPPVLHAGSDRDRPQRRLRLRLGSHHHLTPTPHDHVCRGLTGEPTAPCVVVMTGWSPWWT